MNNAKLIAIASDLTRKIPRIKGLGIPISYFAKCFSQDDVYLTKPVFGSLMQLNSSDLIGNMLLFAPNYYDRRERKFISTIIEKGDYVIDVGANIGTYTLLLSKLVGPTGSVTAIEAEHQNAEQLRYNLKLNHIQNVSLRECGVSNKQETLSLLLNKTGNAGGHSFYSQDNDDAVRIQPIKCFPLAEVIESARQPKFLKMDIEGFEHRVMSNYFERVESSYWPLYLMLEDDPARREADAIRLCIDRGYEILGRFDYNVILTLET